MSAPESSAVPELPPPPLRVLQLSTLLWEWKGPGRPFAVSVDEDPQDELIGRYSSGPSTRIVLNLDSPWSSEHSAFIYNLPETQSPLPLRYTRRTLVGTIPSHVSDEGTIIGIYSSGSPETIGPKVCVHRVDEDPFPENLELEKGLKRGPGPPFDFVDFDWASSRVQPSGIGVRQRALNIDVPDLPGQSEDDLEELTHEDDDEIEEDELLGWSGEWVKDLLERRERGDEVGTRTEVKWFTVGRTEGGKWFESILWGVEVEFEAQSFEEYAPDIRTLAGKRYLQGYTATAAIKRIFIAPEWYKDPDDERPSSGTK